VARLMITSTSATIVSHSSSDGTRTLSALMLPGSTGPSACNA
jgi:hypothetical protein